MSTLVGERIILKPIDINDSKDYVEWRNSSFVRNRFLVRTDFTVEQQDAWIKSISSSDQVKQFIIMLKNPTEKIGSTYLLNIDSINRKAEFGIFLKSNAFAGKGYGHEATKMILSYGFETLNLNKVYLRVLADNKIAISSYLKSGFVQEGIAREDVFVDGCFVDIVYMSILKKDFLK